MRVFWPRSGLTRADGQAVGWRKGDIIVVVAIVEDWLAQQAGTGRELNGVDALAVVAECASGAGESGDVLRCAVKQGLPVRCSEPAQVILFDPPDPRRLRYLTLSPSSSDANGEKKTHKEMVKQYGYATGKQRENGLGEIIPLLNRVREVQRTFRRTADAVASSTSPVSSTSKKPLDAVSQGPTATSSGATGPSEAKGAMTQLSTAASSLFTVSSSWSSTCHQLHLRMRQLLGSPAAFTETLARPDVPLVERSRRYMKFWNTVWLILNDLILGYCARQILVHFREVIVAHSLVHFKLRLVDDPIIALQWLNDWPVGLKLNTPLSAFFCASFGMIIQYWGDVLLPQLQLRLPTLLDILALVSLGGFTLLSSLLRDFLALSTIHLYICHKITLSLVQWQLDSLSGLWNLFRGKRWNVLRQRTDSYAYEIDQLFLGTLLFTVSAFLFPTVLTYAAMFAVTRWGVLAIDTALAWAIAALNAFPLFEVLLRIKEPSRLPAGVTFQIRHVPTRLVAESNEEAEGVPITHYLELKNAPKSLASILSR